MGKLEIGVNEWSGLEGLKGWEWLGVAENS